MKGHLFLLTLQAMNFSALEILTLVLSLLAIVACFVPRVSASLIAYGALICSHFAHVAYATDSVLLYWGIVTAIVVGLRFIQKPGLSCTRAGIGYISCGAIVGAVLGFVIRPAAALIIIGAFAGAFLGSVAYVRTPSGRRESEISNGFVNYTAAKGLPIVVAVSMAVITAAAIVLPYLEPAA